MPENMLLFKDVLLMVISLLSITIAIISLVIAKKSYNLRDISFRIHSIFSVLSQEYLDRKFKSTDPPIIDKKEFNNVRLLKKKALAEINTDINKWQKEVLKDNSWQNKISYEIGISLERVGIATFSGAIPLSIVFALLADQIIDDWIICHTWVANHRQKEMSLTPTNIPFHRRHAEWLSILCALWMKDHYPSYKSLEKFYEIYGGEHTLKNIFTSYTELEKNSLNKVVKKQVKEYFDIKL